jgi:hypothetical protein
MILIARLPLLVFRERTFAAVACPVGAESDMTVDSSMMWTSSLLSQKAKNTHCCSVLFDKTLLVHG